MPKKSRKRQRGSKGEDEKKQNSDPAEIQVGPTSFPTDLTVKLNNFTIHTHKLILVSSGDVFQTIIANDAECTELDCSMDIGKLQGVEVTKETWIAFLKCLYPTMIYKPEHHIQSYNFTGIAALAKKYNVPALTQFCDKVGLSEVKAYDSDEELVKNLDLWLRLGLKRCASDACDELLPKLMTWEKRRVQTGYASYSSGPTYSTVMGYSIKERNTKAVATLLENVDMMSQPTLASLVKKLLTVLSREAFDGEYIDKS